MKINMAPLTRGGGEVKHPRARVRVSIPQSAVQTGGGRIINCVEIICFNSTKCGSNPPHRHEKAAPSFFVESNPLPTKNEAASNRDSRD
jgi:hypothetical protein